jgi:hypothetical protein
MQDYFLTESVSAVTFVGGSEMDEHKEQTKVPGRDKGRAVKLVP